MIDRRTILQWFGWGAAAAVTGVDGVSSAAQAGPLSAALPDIKGKVLASAEFPVADFPIGAIYDFAEAWVPPYSGLPSVSAEQTPMMMLRRKIFDGEKWVDFDSPEATAILNRLLLGWPANAPRR